MGADFLTDLRFRCVFSLTDRCRAEEPYHILPWTYGLRHSDARAGHCTLADSALERDQECIRSEWD